MNTLQTYKIAAVVVTYNRLELLKQCIDSLRKQTRKLNEIVVVNNSSTDGTLEWLIKQNDLTFITQQNSGSAGGQYTGIKTAYEKGYDWVWCMDDDCNPAKKSLEELIRNMRDDNYVINSLVLSTSDKNKLAFGLYEESSGIFYGKVDEINFNDSIKSASFFNGTLIHKKVISKVGYPMSDLFIRGDEVEYYQRIKRNGFKMITIPHSILLHPPANLKIINTYFFNHWFEFLDKSKRYYRARNFIYNMKTYKNFSLRTFLKILILDNVCILIYQKDLLVLFSNINGLLAGLFFKPLPKKKEK